MIVVAIIGVLASIAIPGIQRSQQTSKRSETDTNLAALASAQKRDFAEANRYVAALPEPMYSQADGTGTTRPTAIGGFGPLIVEGT